MGYHEFSQTEAENNLWEQNQNIVFHEITNPRAWTSSFLLMLIILIIDHYFFLIYLPVSSYMSEDPSYTSQQTEEDNNKSVSIFTCSLHNLGKANTSTSVKLHLAPVIQMLQSAIHRQHAKKVVFNSPRLVDFAIQLVNSVFN